MKKSLKIEIINQMANDNFLRVKELKGYLNDCPNKCKFIGKQDKKGTKCKDYVKVLEVLVKQFEHDEKKKEAYQDYLILHNNIIKMPENMLKSWVIECKIRKDLFTFYLFYVDGIGIVGCIVGRLFWKDFLAT